MRVVGQFLAEACEAGVTALVECTPRGSMDGLPSDGFRGYTALTKQFLPAFVARGVSQEQIRQTTFDNPAGAFSF